MQIWLRSALLPRASTQTLKKDMGKSQEEEKLAVEAGH